MRNILFIFITFLSIVWSAVSHSSEVEKITIQLKWLNQFQFAGYYAAREKGFFAEEGLDVTLQERNLQTSQIEEVIAGKAEYGVADAGLVLERLKGRPVVLLAQIFQHSPLVLIALQESGVNKLEDLLGQRVMFDNTSNEIAILAMLKTLPGGLDALQLVPHSYRLEELQEKNIKAISFYRTTQPYWFQERKTPIKLFDPRDYGIDIYGDNLFTTEQELFNHPERVEKVVRAVRKGWKYVFDHPDEIVDLILAKYNTQNLSGEQLLFEAEQTRNMVLPDFFVLGSYDQLRYKKYAELFVELGFSTHSYIHNNFFYQSKEKRLFSQKELEWMENNPQLTVGVDQYPPFLGLDDQGKMTGIVSDFIAIIEEATGISFKVVSAEWSQLLAGFKQKKIDILPATYYTTERAEFGLFSSPYLSVDHVLYTRVENKTIHSLDDLAGRQLAIVKDYASIAKLRKKYPQIDIIETANQRASIEAVLSGRVDALLDAQIAIDTIIEQASIEGVKAVALPGYQAELLHFFSTKDQPVLQSILNKVIESVNEQQKKAIVSKWVKKQENKELPDFFALFKTDEFTGVISAIFIFLFVILIIIPIASRFLSDETIAKNFGSAKFRISALGFLVLILALISLLVWQTLEVNRKKALIAAQEKLNIVLHITMEKLDLWVDEHKQFLLQLGKDPELLNITKQLLLEPVDRNSLNQSHALKQARDYFKQYEDRVGSIGFFIINRDRINIGSARYENLGATNLIAEQRPDILNKVFYGEVAFVPPIQSDVPLYKNSTEKPLTLFFAAPIQEKDGTVIAVMTQRIKLHGGRLSDIMKTGQRIGVSGESYLLNADGKLISESRFRDDLYKIGLLEKGGLEAGRLDLKDPGGNLLLGHKAELPIEKQAFTRMVETLKQYSGEAQLRQKKNILNIYEHSPIVGYFDGYRDYRGVRVLGSGFWDYSLELGIVIEIDVEEALAGYYSLRLSLVTITLVTVLLTVIALSLMLVLGERATKAMRRARKELENRVEERTKALQSTEIKSRAIIEVSQEGVVVINALSNVVLWNRAAEVIFGYAANEMLGHNLNKVIYEDLWGMELQDDEQPSASSSSGFGKIETVGVHENGQIIPLEFSLGQFDIEDEAFLSISIRDITERKSAENRLIESRRLAEAANQAKSEFLANMSHEIRTPMNAIIGMSKLALDGHLQAREHNFVNKVHHSAKLLLGIINDILDFSKIEAGKLELEVAPFSLQAVVDNFSNLLGLKASEKGLYLSINIAADVPTVLQGDSLRLSQVLVNLGNNAVKFTEKGQISVSVMVERQERQNVCLHFTVSDTGCGIAEEKLKSLFQPFYQTDSSISRNFGGSGLGLSICKKLTEMMEGRIWVDTLEGKGSDFHFTAEFGIGDETDLDAVTHDASQLQYQLKGVHVLVVEDNEINQELAKELLESFGIKVSMAENGLAALESLKSLQVDAVLMDVQMPLMDGYTATREIRKQATFADLPIIAMTANVMRSDIEKALAAGMNDHLGKPLDVDEIVATLTQWLAKES